MNKRKTSDKPMMAFLLAIIIYTILFAVNWEPVVQGHAKSAAIFILHSILYVVGALAFWWSYSVAKENKSLKWQRLSLFAIIVAIAWIGFLIFASVLGYYWSKAWEQSNWQF